MKKQLLLAILFIASIGANSLLAQNKDLEKKKKDPNYFDEAAAYDIAKAKGVQPIDQKAYVEYLRNVFNSKQNQKTHNHSHNNPVKSVTINLNPNNTQSIGCGNMGFENYDFTNWSGTTGTLTQNNPIVTYNATATNIVNPSGNNVFMNNASNYHTILTIPPTNPLYPNCNPGGYDSIAVKNVGGQIISEIPFVSPFSFDGASARIGGTSPGEAGELKYTVTKSSTVQQISFSYALVLQNGGIGHSLQSGPIFSVKVIDQTTGAILPGCTSYTFDPYSNNPADSLKQSAIASGVYYRKWNNYSVDLSSLPNGTNVTVVFLVTGCALGGHFGYAYVDAQCGSIGTPYANMCSGSNFATLVAPPGYTSYQWIGPSGTIAGATNDTLIENPATLGTTYTVNMTAQGSCLVTQTVTIGLTTVNIINLNSTNSCANGASGTAFVQANGSNGIYTYTWTATSGTNTGAVVSHSQTATGLSPGTYSVLVASTSCGQASANLTVGTAPPFYLNQLKPFCGTSTFIAQPNGSNYTWYSGSTLIPAPNGTNDTLYISNAVAGDLYTVVYNNQQGCRDSIRYTLSQVTGGYSYFSNVTNVCPNDSNGTAILNLNTPFPSPYSYVVTGPSSSHNVLSSSTTATAVSISSLAPGTYTAIITDGVCIYNNTVSIGVISTNFTMTPTHTVLCFPEEAVVKLDFGGNPPSACGTDASLCSGPATQLFSTGPFANNTGSTYPSPFSGYWYSGKHQFLVKAADLNAAGISAGKISSLAFKITALNTSPLVYPDYQIKMGCTQLTTLPTGANQPFITGLTTVYFNPNQSISLGWLTHNFSQSYIWDGVSNLIIEVCTGGLTSFPDNASIELKQMPYIANMKSISFSSGVSSCPDVNANQNGTYMTNGANMLPNMQFGYCSAAAPASNFTVSVSNNATITANYSNDSIRIAPTFTTPPTGTGVVVYTVSVKNPIGGCVASQTLAIKYPPLTTTVAATPTTFTLCEGSSTTFSASGAANYNWYYNQAGTLMPISTASVINVTPPSVGTNTYVVTGTPICPSGTPDTKTVTVHVNPLATLLITPLADITKCLNKDFVYSTSIGSVPSNTAATYSYTWTTLPSGAPAPGINNTPSYTVSSNSTSTLVVSVSASCSIPTSDTVVVKNFSDNLSVSISNSLTACPNTQYTLTSTTNGGHAPYFYTWTSGTNTLATTPNVTAVSAGNGGAYTITVTVMDSCSYVHSNTQIINVLPNTLKVVVLDSASLCGGTPFTLNAQASIGYPNYTYQWATGGVILSNSQALTSNAPTTEGNYVYTVTATDSCGYKATDIQLINVLPPCMVEIPNVITPNGDTHNDYFKIKNIEYHPNTVVTIFDRWGKKVFESTNYNNEWKGDGVSDGTYFYIIDVPEDKKYSGFITVFRN